MAGVSAMPRVRLRMLAVALATGAAVAPALVIGVQHAVAAPQPAAAGCTDVTGIAVGATPTVASISAAHEVDCFTFTAKSSDRVRLRVVATSGNLVASSEIDGTKGSAICGPATAVDQTCAIKNNGTQTIAVQDAGGTGTGGYTVSVQSLKKPVGCSTLALGSPSNSGSITVPGRADCYTVKVGKGIRLITRVVATSGAITPTVEVLNANGNTLCGPDATLEQNCRLIIAGTFTVLVRDSNGPATGGYSLYAQLNKTQTCTALKYGKALQASITAAGETDCYRVVGMSGDGIRVAVAPTSGTLVTQTEVLKPNGTTMCQTSSATEQTCRVTDEGAQTILVSDLAGTKTGNYTIYAQLLNDPASCKAASYGQHNQQTPGTIAFPGAQNCYVFNGTGGTGAHLKVTKTGGTWTPRFEMIKPNGNNFDERDCDVNATDIRCVLPVSGQYLIIIRDADAVNTGTYNYSLTERLFTD